MKFTNEQIEQGLDKIFDNLLQTKDVEASESMEITPDEGYAGIKKVNLTVKGGGGSSIEYLDLRGYDPINDRAIAGVIGVSLLWNALNNGVSLIGPVAMITSVIQGNLEKLLACAVDFSVSLSIGPSGILTAKDFLLQSGVSEEAIASIPRLTTEEFYNLNA